MPAEADQLHVRFEAASLRQAVELAGELRIMGHGRVQVRPAPRRLLSRRWNVTMTTQAGPPPTVQDLTAELKELADRHSGCRFVGVDVNAREHPDDGPVGVLIVDDSPPFRRAARDLLLRRGYLVVAEVATASAARDAVERLSPDALLVDVGLPDGCGFELATALTRARPELAVLLVSASDPPALDERLRLSGARGFVLKSHLAAAPLDRFWRAPSPRSDDVERALDP